MPDGFSCYGLRRSYENLSLSMNYICSNFTPEEVVQYKLSYISLWAISPNSRIHKLLLILEYINESKYRRHYLNNITFFLCRISKENGYNLYSSGTIQTHFLHFIDSCQYCIDIIFLLKKLFFIRERNFYSKNKN